MLLECWMMSRRTVMHALRACTACEQSNSCQVKYDPELGVVVFDQERFCSSREQFSLGLTC